MTLQHTIENFSDINGSTPVDWSHLQPDLLYLISRKLTDICDFVRFRVVCKRWRFGVKSSELAPQLPWIMGESRSSSIGKGCLCYSLLTGKNYIVNVQQTWGKLALKSACNHIISFTWPRERFSLFNPLTKEEDSHPQLPKEILEFPYVSPPHLDQCSSCVCVCLVEFKKPHSAHLFYCHLGDPKWTKIYIGDLSPTKSPKSIDNVYDASVALYDGMRYISDQESGSTKVIDLAKMTMTYNLPRPETAELPGLFVYLVVSFGEILRVCWYNRYRLEGPCYFVIYRLDLGNNRDENSTKLSCWIKINSIIDQMLFLHGDRGCASRANDFPGFVGNCIYFTKFESIKKTYELFRYDMKDGKIEVLHVPMKLGPNWFVPSLYQ